MTKKIYTFFFQYKDLTYVHQFKSLSKEKAFISWAKEIVNSINDEKNPTFELTISEEVEDTLNNQGLILRNNLINVWTCAFVFDDKTFADLNITITEN